MDIGLLAHVAVGILPVIHLKGPTGRLVADSGIPVGTLLAPFGGTFVHIGQAVLSGIVGEGAALAVLGSEGESVVIDTEVLLLARLCRPPSSSGSSGRTASHVGHLAVVDAPLLLGDALEVVRVVNLGLVEGVFLLDTRLADAVTVTKAEFNGVSASLGVLVTYLLQGRVGRTVKDPYRIDASLWSVFRNHLVGLLIDSNLEVHATHGGDIIGVSTVETLRCARSKANSQQE